MDQKPAKAPHELRSLKQWVVWKNETRGDKPTKVPYQASGKLAESNNPDTWSGFLAAVAAFSKGGYSGVGFMFSHYDKFVGIDLDGCRNPETGEVAPWAKKVIQELNSYSEMSPTETGVKIFCRGKSPFETGRKKDLDEPKVSEKPPGIEIYSEGRYFAVTGWKMGGMPDKCEERDLYFLRERFWGTTKPAPSVGTTTSAGDRASKYVAKLPAAVSGSSGHNATFHAACILVIEFALPQDEALGILREYNQRCEPPWSERELLHKIKSAAGQPGERGRLRDTPVKDWGSVTVPFRAEGGSKPQPKIEHSTLEGATSDYLKALEADKLNLISLGIPDVDYAIGGGVAAGEVVILAARPSHGKSAVALQCVHSMTADGLSTVLISEEMGSLAIGKRAIQYATDIPEEHWKTSLPRVQGSLDAHFEKRATCRLVSSCGQAEVAAEEIRKAVMDIDAKLAVVDYLQLLKSKGRSRYEEITNASICLKQVTTETGVTLLMLCQLSREIEKRTKFIPMMSDLRDSGQLEQDADVILFLCWPHRIDSKNKPEEFLIFAAKNKNRAINQAMVRCEFKPLRQMLVAERPFSQAKEFDFDNPPSDGKLFT